MFRIYCPKLFSTLLNNLRNNLLRSCGTAIRLRNNLLRKYLRAVQLEENPHILKISWRKAFRLRHLHLEIKAQALEKSATGAVVN